MSRPTPNSLNSTDTDLTTNTDAKYQSFWTVPGTSMMYYKYGAGTYMQFNFSASQTAQTAFTNNAAYSSFSGTYYGTPSHNTGCTAGMGTSAQTHGLNFTGLADGSYPVRSRLGHYYEVNVSYHCNYGIGMNYPGYAVSCSSQGSCDGSIRLFVK